MITNEMLITLYKQWLISNDPKKEKELYKELKRAERQRKKYYYRRNKRIIKD